MMEQTAQDMNRIGYFLACLEVGAQRNFMDWQRLEPSSADEFITESARALMAAKCLVSSPGDVHFHKQCTALVALAIRRPEAGMLFRELAKADLNTPDPMLEPAMIDLARDRIGGLLTRLLPQLRH